MIMRNQQTLRIARQCNNTVHVIAQGALSNTVLNKIREQKTNPEDQSIRTWRSRANHEKSQKVQQIKVCGSTERNIFTKTKVPEQAMLNKEDKKKSWADKN